MNRDVNEALDQSLILIQSGQATLEECLSRWPKHTDELRPLLEVALQVYRAPVPNPSPLSTAAAKTKMLDALAERKRLQAKQAHPPVRNVDGVVARIVEQIKIGRTQCVSHRRLALAAVVVLLTLVVGGVLLPSWLTPSLVQAASLGEMSGDVEILTAGSEVWQRASPGDRVEVGDRIRTGPRSSAALEFADGSTTDLGENCRVTVTQMRFSSSGAAEVIVMRQTRGETHSRVQKLSGETMRFEIRTPSAVAVVSGTEFSLSVEPDGTTRVVVIEGIVKVTAQDVTVDVSDGEETAVQPDRPPNPGRPAEKNRAPKPTKDKSSSPQKTKEPPGQTKTPQPPGKDKTPKDSEKTKRPESPAPEKTKEAPGQNKSRPKTPKHLDKEKPPRRGREIGPSISAKTSLPAGQEKTTHPPGRSRAPKPSKQSKKP